MLRPILTLLPLLLGLAPTPLYSQTARKLAVVVGNNEYRANQGLDNLNHAVDDARNLSSALRAAGFTVIEMTHEVASKPGKAVFAPNADYIRDQLSGVIDTPNLGADDTVVVCLHGHGVQFDLEEPPAKGSQEKTLTPKFYFCAADTWVKDIKLANEITERNHLLPLDEIYASLGECQAATKLLIVDACRNDPSRKVLRNLNSVTLPKLPPPPGGIAAFFSCRANQEAIEDPALGQGVFTHFLIQGLSGKADQPLENSPADGTVTLAELTAYVANNTYAYVFEKYAGRKQSPDMKGEFDTNTPLVRRSTSVPAKAAEPEKYFTNSVGMKLALIPSGEFLMGSTAADIEKVVAFDSEFKKEYADDEQPQRRVRISRPFYLGLHEVTRGQFAAFVRAVDFKTEAERDGQGGYGFDAATGKAEQKAEYTWRNAGFPQDDAHPVVNVSWNDAVAFCEWLSKQESKAYKLPSEAQWEYACRAGTASIFSSGNDPESLAAIGNIADASAKEKFTSSSGIKSRDGHVFTAPVGKYKANALGLHDMHGNVFEWCQDWYDEKYYTASPTADPIGPTAGSNRVLRGGCWDLNPRDCRSAIRYWFAPDDRDYDLGFRVALVLQGK